MYLNGRGVSQDDTVALKWFQLAAEQGTPQAYEKLGIMYFLGRGVLEDHVQAHMWSNLAGAAGVQSSAELRDRLAKMMTPAQIAEAQKLAREWKPKEK
jgi:uncharacterized protein